ncbi:ATP-binding protein [Loktanella sp. R86503]|uniref:hybrid sensor histidine kinase/response regulator n=1 Tax=Loktanella sp. R86503 TaxID=3093847 RepID=UPI0036D8F9A7
MSDQELTDLAISSRNRLKAGRTFAVLSGLLALLAIIFLAFSVIKEIRLLGSANSDNVQWQLSQTEVEFLEFSQTLSELPVNLGNVRQRFDIFYSRITTVERATVFQGLRANDQFQATLNSVRTFLQRSVPVIDSDDADLLAALPDLRQSAEQARRDVRDLSNGGLDLFASASDAQRQAIARTLIQLGAILAALIGVLAVAVLYLNRLLRALTLRERQQQQTSNRMNAIISSSLDGVIVSDAQGRILTFSPAAEEIFGFFAEDVVGRDLGEVVVPQHLRELHYAGMERMRQKGAKKVVGKGRVQLEALRSDGSTFPVELAIHASTTDDGEIFISFLRDITKRVADEAELVAARDAALAAAKLKTDFLATMSHEIRTPLNGLLGNLDLMSDTDLSLSQSRYVRNMQTSGRLLMRHISDVLDITRYDAGKMTTKSHPMNLSELLQDIVDSQTSMAAANQTTLTWAWQGQPQDWINSDADRLQHVLLNLVGNAVKFTRNGTVTLTVAAKPDGDTIHLDFSISDTGPGMSAELASHVFDDFVTGNTAYDRDVGGTGLGLSIAKRFVSAMNGQIGVDSVLGHGSTFWVRLPVTAAAPADVQPAPSPLLAVPQRPLQVLVVEDNEINRTVVRDMLEKSGHRVTEANDGRAGVTAALSRRFDLILMDISMPVMDGRAATRAIRRGTGPSIHTPIIALTANAMQEEQTNFLADGMDGILTKPLTKAALAEVLGRHTTATPPEVQTAPAQHILDHKHNGETRELLGKSGYARLSGLFVDEVEQLLRWLDQPEAQDETELAQRCHKFAGSAAVFGATALHQQLKDMETAAKQGDGKAVKALNSKLPAIWQATRTLISEIS